MVTYLSASRSPTSSTKYFKVLLLTFKSLIHLELIFIARDRNIISFFPCINNHFFLVLSIEKSPPFLTDLPCHLCYISKIKYVEVCLETIRFHEPVSLVSLLIFVATPHYLKCRSFTQVLIFGRINPSFFYNGVLDVLGSSHFFSILRSDRKSAFFSRYCLERPCLALGMMLVNNNNLRNIKIKRSLFSIAEKQKIS